MKRLLIAIILFFCTPLWASDCREYSALGTPGTSGDLLCREGYLLSHDPARKVPLWVIERLTREKATAKAERKDAFRPDPDLPKGKRAELSDYLRSGFDRGHMAPAADFRWSGQAMAESFYLSNMVPQVGRGMNRGIWIELERMVRTWAVDRGELFIFTGPVFEDCKTIGKNRVAVPTHIYKIIYDQGRREAIAFLMPNVPLRTRDMPIFITSIREIEQRTGLDFLSSEPQDTQDAVEITRAGGLWTCNPAGSHPVTTGREKD